MDAKMKTVIENTEVTATTHSESNSLAWDDVMIYNEMADQPSVRSNLLEQIKKQMAGLEEMSARRQFLTREIMGYITK